MSKYPPFLFVVLVGSAEGDRVIVFVFFFFILLLSFDAMDGCGMRCRGLGESGESLLFRIPIDFLLRSWRNWCKVESR